jgi:hypothetical protein
MPPLTRWVLDDDGHPKQVSDRLTWANWVNTHRQPLATDQIGDVTIKTVFLALDVRSPSGVGVPLLFETFVVGGTLDTHSSLYGSRDAALIGHHAMVDAVTRSEEQR